jgi:RNA polymerase sigma factor (sigma-70 family)
MSERDTYEEELEKKDYYLTITVKNNLLLRMMEAHGIPTAAELSRQSGVDQSTIGRYLRLLSPAYAPCGGLYRNAERLCSFFKCLPDHIFPEEHLYTPLETNTSSVEVSMEELKSIPGLVSSSPETVLISAEVDNALDTALNSLTARQQGVVRMRYGLLDGKEYTYKEIGEKYDVSVERARQIERKALRLLSHPKRADKIRDALE